MRNEELKNKLNNIPQNFDHEQLWSSIDLPKKKGEKRRFFWLFFIGIVSLVIISTTIFYNQNNTPQLFTSDEELEINKKSADNNLTEENTLSKSENMASYNSSPSQINTNAIEKDSYTNSDVSKTIKPNVIKQKRSIDNTNYSESPSKNLESIIDTGLNSNVENSLKEVNRDSENVDGGTKNSNDESINNDGSTERVVGKNFLLLPLPYFLELHPKEFNFDLKTDFEKIEDISIANKYGVTFFALYGMSNHDFGSSADRMINETALESFSFGLLGLIKIKNFELIPGLSFTNHNTILNQEIKAISLLEGVNGPTRKTRTTQYSLYNSYQYIDFNLGVGYGFSFGNKWSIRPSLHGSYTINFNPNGDIIDVSDELIQLTSLDEYKDYSKWQGRAHLEISRAFGKYWEVGILGYLSTSKTLANFDDYTHSVSSKGVGVRLSRYLK